MQTRPSLFHAHRSAVAPLVAVTLLLTGCAGAGSQAAEPSLKAALGHVHGISVDPESAGKIWESLSKSGESDFHALTVSGSALVAFDGQLQTSPASSVVLATTENGMQRSTDSGLTWTAAGTIKGQVEAVTAVQGDTDELKIWAATTTGIQISTDGGATFHPVGSGD